MWEPGTHGRGDVGLSSLRVHELHLCVGSHAASIAPLGLHLVLDGANLEQNRTESGTRDGGRGCWSQHSSWAAVEKILFTETILFL